MKNALLKKVNGEVEIINLETTPDGKKEVKGKIDHLCSKCDNCYAAKCLKVFDEVKQLISEYDFITDGLQLYDSNGEMKFFYVTECDDYKEDRKRHSPSTKEEIENLKRIRESIKIAYFNAETIEEADQTQFDLFRRKQLSFSSESDKSKKNK